MIDCDTLGGGPPLVLVHGSFSDHRTNWEFVLPYLTPRFTVYALARRGRGSSAATTSHSVEDESRDVAAVIRDIGEPVRLLGHSYGAHVALGAAAMASGQIHQLTLYEPPRPSIFRGGIPEPMAMYAETGDWDGFTFWFFRNILRVPLDELNAVRASELWPDIVADAPASLQDIRALSGYRFRPSRFSTLAMPVLLQTGSLSPRQLYVTDALAAALPQARVETLEGQAHEAMTTAPRDYADSVIRFAEERPAPRFPWAPRQSEAAPRTGVTPR